MPNRTKSEMHIRRLTSTRTTHLHDPYHEARQKLQAEDYNSEGKASIPRIKE